MHDRGQYWREVDLRRHNAWLLGRPTDFAPDGFDVMPARHVTITTWPEFYEEIHLVPTLAIPGDDLRLDVPPGVLLVACLLTAIEDEGSAIVEFPTLDESSRELICRTVAVSRHMVREGKLAPGEPSW